MNCSPLFYPHFDWTTTTDDFPVVNQFYKAEILTEYVIRGNTAVLKCSIPSFVADYVFVEAWLDDSGKIMTVSNDYGNSKGLFCSQSYRSFM